MVAMDALERKDIPILFRKHGMQRMPFFMELFSTGMESAMDQDTFYHHEDMFFNEPMIAFENTAGGAAGATVTIRIALANIVNATTFLRKNDNLLFPGRVTAQISNIIYNGATDIDVQVKPHLAAQAIPAVVANQRIGVIGNAKSRGSANPPAIAPRTEKFSHKFQIISETTGVEGSLLAEADWIKTDSMGRSLPNGVWSEATAETEYRQACAISNTLLFQNYTDNGNVDSTNNNAPIQTTEGFFPWAIALGLSLPVAVGAFSLDDFDDIVRYQKTQFIGKYCQAKLPITRYMDVQDALGLQFTDSNIPQIGLQASKDLPGFDSLTATQTFAFLNRANVVFMFNEFEELNDNQVFPQGGEYSSLACYYPMGTKKFTNDKVPSPIIGYRYKAMNGYSRRMEVFKLAGAGGQETVQYTTDIDDQRMFFRSEIASDFKLGNQVVIMPTA